jgi:hypothetical protein
MSKLNQVLKQQVNIQQQQQHQIFRTIKKDEGKN